MCEYFRTEIALYTLFCNLCLFDLHCGPLFTLVNVCLLQCCSNVSCVRITRRAEYRQAVGLHPPLLHSQIQQSWGARGRVWRLGGWGCKNLHFQQVDADAIGLGSAFWKLWSTPSREWLLTTSSCGCMNLFSCSPLFGYRDYFKCQQCWNNHP